MGFSSSVPFLVAHEHSNVAGDGGVLSSSTTRIGIDLLSIFMREELDWQNFRNTNLSAGAGQSIALYMAYS